MIKFDTSELKKAFESEKTKMQKAVRPAAQAGSQVIYEMARLNAYKLRSKREHYFYGAASKSAQKGQKKARAYGPFQPGNLYESIYQVYSRDNSNENKATYHVSWNADKAPYGAMVEFGTSRAAAHPFIGPAIVASQGKAAQAIKTRFIQEVGK